MHEYIKSTPSKSFAQARSHAPSFVTRKRTIDPLKKLAVLRAGNIEKGTNPNQNLRH